MTWKKARDTFLAFFHVIDTCFVLYRILRRVLETRWPP